MRSWVAFVLLAKVDDLRQQRAGPCGAYRTSLISYERSQMYFMRLADSYTMLCSMLDVVAAF